MRAASLSPLTFVLGLGAGLVVAWATLAAATSDGSLAIWVAPGALFGLACGLAVRQRRHRRDREPTR